MKNAWQVLGTDVRGGRDAAGAMQAAGLDWDVYIESIRTEYHDLRIPGKFALTTGRRVFSVVGNRHKVIQNHELVPALEVMREDGEFYAAGQTGSVVFVTIRRTDGHLVSVVNGHDTKTPLSVVVTPVAGSALLDAHWFSLDLSAKGSGEALLKIHDYLDWFVAVQGVLKEEPLSSGAFRARAVRLLTSGSGKAAVTRNTNKLDQMSDLFGDGTTAHDGLVALCTWYDHFSPVRGDDTVRARKAIFEPKFKARALDLMLGAR